MTQKEKIVNGISELLRAGYPIVHIRTTEDFRAMLYAAEAVKDYAKRLETTPILGVFRSTTGYGECPADVAIAALSLNTEPSWSNTTKDVSRALDTVADEDREDAIVGCFLNVGHLMKNPVFVQKLKDSSFICRATQGCIVLIGPSMQYPEEVRDSVVVFDLPLPDRDYLQSMLDNLVERYASVLEEIPDDDLRYEAATAASGLIDIQAENAYCLSMVRERRIVPEIIQRRKEEAVKQSDVLEFVHPKFGGLESLGGFKNLKRWLLARRSAFSKEAREYGLEPPKGLLLVGIPGSGKSLAANCVAQYFKIPLIRLDMGRIFKSLVGASEGAMREALKTVEAVAPVVLWVDEIEKAMSGTNSSGSTDGGTTARVMSTILTWMQENQKPVFVMATANQVRSLPPELLRKGRFSEIFGVLEPTQEERKEIWEIHLQRVRKDTYDQYDIERLSEVSDGYTGAEIEVALQEAMYNAFADDKREFTTDDIISALSEIVPQSVTARDEIDEVREWMVGKVRFVSDQQEAVRRGTSSLNKIRQLAV